jgi:flagellar motor component MotA
MTKYVRSMKTLDITQPIGYVARVITVYRGRITTGRSNPATANPSAILQITNAVVS